MRECWEFGHKIGFVHLCVRNNAAFCSLFIPIEREMDTKLLGDNGFKTRLEVPMCLIANKGHIRIFQGCSHVVLITNSLVLDDLRCISSVHHVDNHTILPHAVAQGLETRSSAMAKQLHSMQEKVSAVRGGDAVTKLRDEKIALGSSYLSFLFRKQQYLLFDTCIISNVRSTDGSAVGESRVN